MVMLDSFRKDHVGAYGNDWIRTPNLDRFAAESVRYTRAYPESLPTIPVRKAVYTGTRCYPYPELENVTEFFPPPGWIPIPEGMETLAGYLQKQGYFTGLVADVYHMFKPGMNYTQGFSTWEFIRGQETDNYQNSPYVSDEKVKRYIPEAGQDNRALMEFLRIYLRNNYLAVNEEDRSCARVFREGANWVKNNMARGDFFLTLESFDPHEPWLPPDYYRRLYDADDDIRNPIESTYFPWPGLLTPRELKRMQANYAGLCTMVDFWFGHFMNSLEQAGALEDTLVAVMSDHGHNLGFEKDDNLISKEGHPSTPGVFDLVLMIRHPGGQGAGRVCDDFVYDHELSRTLLEMAGHEPFEGMEGENIWQLALGEVKPPRSHVTCSWGPAITVVTDKWWYNSNLKGEGARLFDHENDPGHRTDLAAERPEVCAEMLELAIADAGGWERIPATLHTLGKRSGCRLNGFSDKPYAVAEWCLVSSGLKE